MFRSSATFEGTGGDTLSETLACEYGAVLQKIGLECSGWILSELAKCFVQLWYGSGFTARILAILL